MNSTSDHILLYARESGAANVLVDFAKCFSARSSLLLKIGAEPAAQVVFEKNCFSVSAYSEIFDENRLLCAGTKAIITGSSIPPEREVALWELAHEKKIPSLALLDQWMNYRTRFALDHKPDSKHLPTAIGVMDELCKKEMIAEGFLESQLFIIGSPYFCDISRVHRLPIEKETGKISVLFLSEPRKSGVDKDFGYSEQDALDALVRALKKSPELKNKKLDLRIKLHPRNKAEDIKLPVNTQTHNQPHIHARLAEDAPMRELLLNSNLVAGMSSAALLEAAALGIPYLSIQPNLSSPDPFLLSRHGLAICATDDAKTEEALKLALTGKLPSWQAPPNQIQNAVKWLLEKL